MGIDGDFKSRVIDREGYKFVVRSKMRIGDLRVGKYVMKDGEPGGMELVPVCESEIYRAARLMGYDKKAAKGVYDAYTAVVLANHDVEKSGEPRWLRSFGEFNELYLSLKNQDAMTTSVVALEGSPGEVEVIDGQHRLAIWHHLKGDAEVTVQVYERPGEDRRVRAVILHHNNPANADCLFDELSKAFEVDLFDSGSDHDKVPVNVTHSFPNIYWTGGWNEILKRYSDCDAVWMLGCDVELRNSAEEYRKAIEASFPFGCWSPCVEGRAHPFMLAENYGHGKPVRVRNVEGMAMALSGELMRTVPELMEGSEIGFGLDYWLCYRARKLGLSNIIDGGVGVFHPEGIGYDEQKAHDQMEKAFSTKYGKDFRRTVFEYDERYEGNLADAPAPGSGPAPPMEVEDGPAKPFTIVTVDNGWGLADFERVAANFPSARKVVMRKGTSFIAPVAGVEVVEYSEDLAPILTEADVALFARVGPANEKEYRRILEAGVPTVVQVEFSQGRIKHEENGFVYGNDEWACQWLTALRDNPPLRIMVRTWWEAHKGVQQPEPEEPDLVVTVITPTWRRDLKVLSRCVDCLRMQTEKRWRQLICSNGPEEPQVRKFVEEMGDGRVEYHCCSDAPEGDHGNFARREMLRIATGRYVMFLDDDNIVLPNYIERMEQELANPNRDFAVCRVMHFGPLNEVEVGSPPKILSGHPVKLYHIDPLQVMGRREAVQDIGWDVDNGYVSDGVTLERLGDKYRAVHITDVLGVHI